MNRSEKAAEIEYLQGAFKVAQNAFLVSFAGLSVSQMTELRQKLRETNSSYRVVKYRLARRAIEGSALELLSTEFKNSTAVAYNDNDPVALAKALSDFAKDNAALDIRVGVIDGKDVLDHDAIQALAKLPGLPELRAQLLSLLNTPATSLVRLLGTPGTELARVIYARRESLSENAG